MKLQNKIPIIIIIFIIVITFILGFPAAAFAQTATLSLEPSSGTFNKGCVFSLNVILDTGGAQTDGTDAIINYDSSRFTASSVTNGTIYPDFPGNNIDAQAGKITISGLASVNTPFSGKGTLATVNFKVSETAPTGSTQATFDFNPQNKAETRDSNVVQRTTIVDVLNSVTNGNYVVGTGACGSQPAVTPAPKPGGGQEGTPSATFAPLSTKAPALPPAGTEQLTFAIAIFGSILTVLGVLGLALL